MGNATFFLFLMNANFINLPFLKGQLREIFYLWFISLNNSIWVPNPRVKSLFEYRIEFADFGVTVSMTPSISGKWWCH
jgi:hypothetical protein